MATPTVNFTIMHTYMHTKKKKKKTLDTITIQGQFFFEKNNIKRINVIFQKTKKKR